MARGHFAKSEAQAASVIKELQGKGNTIESVGTARNYEQALKICCDYLKEHKLGGLRDLTPEIANSYLEIRAAECSQSTINMDRQAIQCMMRHVSGQLGLKEKLDDKIKSEKETILNSRSYTPEQVKAITEHQTERHALSTELCHKAGIRVHELHTLRPSGEVTPSPREVHPDKFSHAGPSQIYTVSGKGGLIREVQIPTPLAERLEQHRLNEPVQITDRGVHYTTHYDIAAGQNFSDAFSKASERALGYSNGAHGLRHSYAQDRYEQLANHFPSLDVMKIVSQEMGHFRPEITEVYLR